MAVHSWKRIIRAMAVIALMHSAAHGTAAQARLTRDVNGSAAARFAPAGRFDARDFPRRQRWTYSQAVDARFAEVGDATNGANPPNAAEGRKGTSATAGSGDAAGPSGNSGTGEQRRHARWKAFIPLSAAVFTMGLLDQTATVGHGQWRGNEQDPLVKPFTNLPTPLFLAGGVAFEGGVNWLAWKMGRSRRWRKIWWLPQVCAVGANAYGYHVSTHDE
jgi:hypothetical protein